MYTLTSMLPLIIETNPKVVKEKTQSLYEKLQIIAISNEINFPLAL